MRCAGSPRRHTAEDHPRARPAAGGRAAPAEPPQDPQTAAPGIRRRWHARGAGSLWPTAQPASRAARSPDITSCAIGKASLPSHANEPGCHTAAVAGAGAATARPACSGLLGRGHKVTPDEVVAAKAATYPIVPDELLAVARHRATSTPPPCQGGSRPAEGAAPADAWVQAGPDP